MKILYHSAAPWVSTGYGRCTREVVPRLQSLGYDVAIQSMNAVQKDSVMWHGDSLEEELEEPIEVYPAESPFGVHDVEESFDKSNADLLFTHFDSWMEVARKTIPEMDIPYISWSIVDHHPVPDAVVEQVNNAVDVAAMSRWAQEEFREKGVVSTYLPHGVDVDSFYPIRNTSEEPPKAVSVIGDDGEQKEVDLRENFVVGMVAANHGDRKHIPGQMEAFNLFLENVTEDAIMYIHTSPNAQKGYELTKVRKEIGIPKDKIIWTRSDDYGDVGDEFLNNWYNAFDVMLNCSMGESWGLTITEAQAAGTPCIVSNFSSMPEQLGAELSKGKTDEYWNATVNDSITTRVHKVENGIVVNPVVGLFREKVSAKQYICSPKDILAGLSYYYRNPEERREDGDNAAEYVRDNYTWDDDVIPRMDNMFKRVSKVMM